MRCHNVQKKLPAYQDKELNPREQQEVSKHLLSCQTCREQYENLEQVWQTMGELQEIHPDQWFYQQIARKIREPRQQGLLPNFQRVFRLMPSPVIASILLVIGILAGTYLGNILIRCDFLPFQPQQTSYSKEALFDSWKAFDPAPPGTLAHGYLRMVSYKESESR